MNNKKNRPQKTSKMLDEKRFWRLIEDSRENCGFFESQHEYLTDKLVATLSIQEIIEFQARFSALGDAIETSKTYRALNLHGLCSDDGFHYLVSRVISCGKEYYYKVKNRPETVDDAFGDYELFGYVAFEAFDRKIPNSSVYDFVISKKQ